ncbi:VanZ family protein [Couchioplanes azureus]|uniref:VanZ family protein n=1 Tax=Couchioplanes caeruleus TaxID=56438 RepID=UPI001670703E|nr:VanZ family protein [Couchioplanes caeruleus]GGQ71247.1 hypothetical protein GCM10010166_46720 [Couchioplanes caeruleus subsp. azureus]
MRYQLNLALDRPAAVALLLCCAIAAGVLFWPMSRLFRWRPGWTLLALLALAPILVFTVPVEAPGWQDGAIYRLAEYVRSFLRAATFQAELQAPASSDEQVANLLLFIPLGVAGALATRRAFRTAAAAATLSFGIEAWQAISGVRVASAADWIYNTGGACAGAAIGLLVLAARRLTRPDAIAPGPSPAPARPPAPAARNPHGDALPEPTLALSRRPEAEPTLDLSRRPEEMTTASLTPRW